MCSKRTKKDFNENEFLMLLLGFAAHCLVLLGRGDILLWCLWIEDLISKDTCWASVLKHLKERLNENLNENQF